MINDDLWKYHTKEHSKEFLLSFKLFGERDWTAQRQLASLYLISNHLDDHYRPLTLTKRDGSLRHLFIPDPLLKEVQRNIVNNVLLSRAISPYATAYFEGADILHNAEKHVGKKMVLKLDIENFFDSITFLMVYKNAFPAIYFPPAVRMLLTHLCCYQEALPQGAPTSAAISNLVMKSFDLYIGTWCGKQGITYTRYCDDMVFSGDFQPFLVINKVRNYLQVIGFKLNEKKTRWASQGDRQSVTGIVVNQKPQVPKAYRRQVRQTFYYYEKYGVPSDKKEDLLSLLGKINFILHINPADSYFIEAKQKVRKWIYSYNM